MSKRDVKDAMQQRVPEPESTREVPEHKRCPICWGRDNGVGVCEGTYKKASTLTRRYYKCDRCGYTWIQNFTPEQVRTSG